MQAALDAFLALALASPRPAKLPLVLAIDADLDTPLTAYWKLRAGPYSFLLESVEGGEHLGRYTLIGTAPRAIHTVRGPHLTTFAPPQTAASTPPSPTTTTPTHPLGALGALLDRTTGLTLPPGLDLTTAQVTALPRFFGGLVGTMAYDAVRLIEHLPAPHPSSTPDLLFMELDLVLVWDNVTHRALLVQLVDLPADASLADLSARFHNATATLRAAARRLAAPMPPLPVAPPAAAAPLPVTTTPDDPTFIAQVEHARSLIAQGDIIQIVLSRKFTSPQANLHPFLVYRTLRTLNPSPFMFYLELGDRALIGASPELLVRFTAATRRVEVAPIAGTCPRGPTPADDDRLIAALKADPKEVAEHVMLVDLGRNDLGRIAEPGTVTVDALMTAQRYSHVTHLVSHVTATARPDVTPASVVAATFPAGTLSGAPKVRAMQIIDAMEPTPRGAYGGAIGTIGIDGSLDLAIAIRTVVAEDDTFTIQAGAGIVWDSVGEREAAETRHKAKAPLTAIEHARTRFTFPEEPRS